MSDELIDEFLEEPEEDDFDEEEEASSGESAPSAEPVSEGAADEGSGEPKRTPWEPTASGAIPFVHLHVHSHYSLLDGVGKLEALIARAKELEAPALALTDHGNMYGALEFYQKALDAGIKPIIGYEAYVAPGKRFERGEKKMFHLTLLAMNNEGYKNLLQLSSSAFLDGFYYKPRIDKDLLEKHSAGLICLSGCLSGELARTLANGNGSEESYEKAKGIAQWFRSVFGDRYYIELQNHGIPDQRIALDLELKLARELGIPTVATNDVHYVLREDADVQDLVLCINTGKFRTDPNRMKMDSDQFFMKSGREMLDAIPEDPDSVWRTLEIADRCHLDVELGKRYFPIFTPPDGLSSDEYLRKLCIEGLKRRYANNPKRMVNGELTEEVMTRLDRELGVISKLGFPNYFLIVWDFVREAESRGIHRTARGSGVGALVCYALNLSHVCPLEFDLLFERFLDENRLEAPDIDIDFEQAKRGEIIDYVKERYGAEKVSQLGVFGTMAAKLAVRDCGRALGVPLNVVNETAKLIPNAPKMTLKKAFDQSPELVKLYEENPDVRELIDYARKVEGLARSAGTHACGVIIAQRALTDFVPVQKLAGKTDVVTQWQGAEVEKAGLLKMDFLGLRNLTILADSVAMIEQTTGKKIDPYNLPQNDPETYALLCRGETKGVFQLESSGIRELLVNMRPDNIRDIIAVLALYRPGPIEGGMIDEYVDVKHKRKEATYLHPVLKEVLEETNGVMVYQEQIMRILNKLGKIPLSSAYTCIKAISKKKHDKIAKFYADFVAGAKENGLTEKKAEELFELIKKFAGYGFNKSHSTAYANVAYTTAYLKAHYPAEFMAALLCGDISARNFTKRDKTVEHVDDCKRMGVEVVPPDVNLCDARYKVIDGKIYFGLTAVKACGEDAMREIERARAEGGPFKGLFDFYERVDSKVCGRSSVEALIKCGAFDCFGVKRSQLILALDKALKGGQAAAADRERGQRSLFGFDEPEEVDQRSDDDGTKSLPDAEEWSAKEKAAYEKETLGFYVTAHPLGDHKNELTLFATSTTKVAAMANRASATIGGSISDVKMQVSKNPKPGRPSTFAFFQIEDLEGTMRCACWPEAFAKYAEFLKNDAIVFLRGRVDKKETTRDFGDDENESEVEVTFFVDEVIPFENAVAEMSRGVAVVLKERDARDNGVKKLYEILRAYRNGRDGTARGADLEIWYERDDGYCAAFRCPEFKLNLNNEMRERVEGLFGDGAFRVLPAPQRRSSDEGRGRRRYGQFAQ
ncbi:MAG: DNA polymerase III subunit alpha [Thermoguttaceae bacterium]|nr:DNA polymerase III subunit alpha [Thermoguttaceae bacterium]